MGRGRLQIREVELAQSRPILRTLHGGRLYGLAGPGSDVDTYEVVLGCSKTFAWNHFVGVDANHIHLSRFQQAVENGAPQALEALFSPVSEIEPGWEAFFAGLRPGIDNARATYRRTIRNFGFGNGGRTGAAAERTDPVKLRRHALRLIYNLDDLVRRGRFNPMLTFEDAWTISVIAEKGSTPRFDFDDMIERSLERALLGRLHTG